MTKAIEIAGNQISQVDWEATPASVKALVAQQASVNAEMGEQLVKLSERREVEKDVTVPGYEVSGFEGSSSLFF